MRIQNSLQNMLFGFLGQIISIIMGFLVRTVFIYTLGIEYLGIEGLFTSILTMLSLANLGFDTAVMYSLYKPLAEKDIRKIQALMNLYQKAYQIIGIVILVIGLCLLPFVPHLMVRETKIENIHIIYLLFLLSSVSSYYFVYKQTMIIADQRNYVISKIHIIFTIISNLTQLFLLILISNYIVVLIMQLLMRLLENIYISKKANQLYPYLKGKSSARLSKEEKKHFFENLYALLLYRISGVVVNGTDNIVISKFIGIAWVGIYSNYLFIINTLNTLLGYLFYSVTASVGNLNVNESKDKKYFIFRVLNFMNFWIYGFFSVLLWNLVNPFIIIWIGEAYTFNKYILFVILLNFFTVGMQNASTTFRETTGLFKKGKYRPIIAAIINIVTSIILVKQIGISGVFIGTIFSRLCTYFWFDPYTIFKCVFQKPVKLYFKKYTIYFLLVLFTAGITDIVGAIASEHFFINVVMRIIICLSIPNVVFWGMFRNTEEFKYVWNILKAVGNKKNIFARKNDFEDGV
ncbi:sugar translocase [Bacillus pacificus]|uniref:lipopolysaccharide biosynthesis protein n=1 Tax=Bacillus pacificus TaxID=2026187 RepID=UPI003D1CADF4